MVSPSGVFGVLNLLSANAVPPQRLTYFLFAFCYPTASSEACSIPAFCLFLSSSVSPGCFNSSPRASMSPVSFRSSSFLRQSVNSLSMSCSAGRFISSILASSACPVADSAVHQLRRRRAPLRRHPSPLLANSRRSSSKDSASTYSGTSAAYFMLVIASSSK